MQVEDFDRAVSALFSQGSAAVNPATRCEAEQYLRAVCDSSSGTTLLLSALQSRCSFEAKFFALQQLLQLLPQQQHQRQQMAEVLLNVMRLRVCSASAWACSSSSSSSGPETDSTAAQLAAAASDPASSPDAAAVHNKLALLVARLLAAQINDIAEAATAAEQAPAAAGAAAAAAGTKAAFLPLRQLLHQELTALCLHLRKLEDPSVTAVAGQCCACRSPACAAAAGQNLAATLESLRVALRVLLVVHQEYLEDLPASPLSAALKSSFPYDEEVPTNAAAVLCPPPFSPLLLQLLQLLQLTYKESPALASLLQLCCSVTERYVGWIDLLLPPPTESAAEAQRQNRDSRSSSRSPTLLQLLGAAWLSSGFPDAASAIVVFIHRKMEPVARIDLLCRMELAEWLLHRIPLAEIAASPTMILSFGSVVNATVAALTESTAALAERLEATGEGGFLGSSTGSSSPQVACRDPGQLLLQGVTALWAVLPLSVQLLGSGGLEVSSTVVASLSLLFSKAAILQRQSALLLQPSPASRLEDLLLELLQVLVKRLAEVDLLMGAVQQQQQMQEQQQQVIYSTLDDDEVEQLYAYKEALTALYRKACAANPCRVLQWIEEGLQQQLQQLQQQQTPQQRREQQQQLSSLLHMILVMTDDIGDLQEKLKDTSSQLHASLLKLLQLLQNMHASPAFSSAASAENFMRVLVRIAPLFGKHQQHIPEALSLLAGPHGVCSSNNNIAPKACLALLRFVKNCLPYSAAYTRLLLQHLLQQQCLEVPRSSNHSSTSPAAQQRLRPATPPSCNNSSRQEPLAVAAAADVYVVPRAFQVEQQLLLYEAAGVLLGSKQQQAAASRQMQGPAVTHSEERVLLLHALLSKATAAFTTDMAAYSAEASPSAAAAVAVYWARCANAMASLSKGFQPFKIPAAAGGASPEGAAEGSVVVELKKSWVQALELFTNALLVAGVEGSPLEIEGASLLVLPPFLPACIFLLRRLMSLLGPLAASPISAVVPLLYDAILVEADSPAAAAAAANSLQQQQHSPEVAAEHLGGFCMQVLVSLKGPEVVALLLQHLPLILERHLGLYLKAVAAAAQEPNSAELQRECRGVQEQLALLLATAAREAPVALLSFAAASVLPSSSSGNDNGGVPISLSTIEQCVSTAIGHRVSANGNRETSAKHALLQLLHQQQQQLHVLLFASLHRSRGASAVTSKAPQGTPASDEICSTTWRCILLFLLVCCCSGNCPGVSAAAVQAWGQLVAALICRPENLVDAQQQQLLQKLAGLPLELRQVQEAMRDFTCQNIALDAQLRQRRTQAVSAEAPQQFEEVQLLRQQQHQRVQGIDLQRAGQQLALILPLCSLFSVVADLFASLKTDDPQYIKLAADIGGLWRVLAYGIPPGTPQRTATAVAAAAAAEAGAQLRPIFFPLRNGIQQSLKDALVARVGNSACAAAALVDALGQTEGQQVREVIRAWQRQFLSK